MKFLDTNLFDIVTVLMSLITSLSIGLPYKIVTQDIQVVNFYFMSSHIASTSLTLCDPSSAKTNFLAVKRCLAKIQK